MNRVHLICVNSSTLVLVTLLDSLILVPAILKIPELIFTETSHPVQTLPISIP